MVKTLFVFFSLVGTEEDQGHFDTSQAAAERRFRRYRRIRKYRRFRKYRRSAGAPSAGHV